MARTNPSGYTRKQVRKDRKVLKKETGTKRAGSGITRRKKGATTNTKGPVTIHTRKKKRKTITAKGPYWRKDKKGDNVAANLAKKTKVTVTKKKKTGGVKTKTKTMRVKKVDKKMFTTNKRGQRISKRISKAHGVRDKAGYKSTKRRTRAGNRAKRLKKKYKAQA